MQYQEQALSPSSSEPASSQETIRHQLKKTYTHPLIDWQQTLTNRPIREENMNIVVTLNLTSALQQSGIASEISPLS